MPTKIKEVQRPRGIQKRGFQLPRWLFRLHAGWLLGDRFLLLTHRGRKSGLPRQTVLEVLQHDKTKEIYYVFSGWGEQSDWVRNTEQTPEVTLTVGRRQIKALARRLSPEEAEPVVLDYARRYPVARRVLPRLMGYKTDGTEEDFAALARLGVVVAFEVLR